MSSSSVPYDHYLPSVFQGEEILQTIRGFSYGYDIYAPSRNVAYHIYAMMANVEKRNNVPKFTENQVFYGAKVKDQACKSQNKNIPAIKTFKSFSSISHFQTCFNYNVPSRRSSAGWNIWNFRPSARLPPPGRRTVRHRPDTFSGTIFQYIRYPSKNKDN